MSRALIITSLFLAFGCDTEDLVDQILPDAQVAEPVNVQINDVDDETPISDLTPEQRDEACQNSIDALNTGVSAADKCELAGMTLAISAASEGLEAAKARCLDSISACETTSRVESAPDVPLDECALFGGPTDDCDLPVSKLELCLTHMASAAVENLAGISCETLSLDQLTDAGFDALGSAVPDTPECIEIELQCPGVFKKAE